MTVWAAVANGNLSTSTTWASVDSTSYLNSETGNTAVTTSLVASSQFTPGAITIDGVGLKIASRAASPTGTFYVELTVVSGLVTVDSVTVNVSDIPTCTATSGTTVPVGTAEGGWMFFKFGSSHTLVAATAYEIRVKTSSSAEVNLWRDSTAANWSRYLRTTTTGAPAAADDLIITGEWTAAATVTARTVTMADTSATAYGSNTTSQVTPSCSICNNGTLTFGTTASTNYVFEQKGYVIVYNGGTLNIGTSGTPVPGTSTAKIEFACTADGDFGVVARNGATVNMYGVPRTSGKLVTQCKLNADASAGATSVTLDTDTGWLSGDVLCFAPTTQTSTQYEAKAATGNATATTIAVAALTNAHSGTAPTQGEVGLLTRNVVFTAVTANVVTFFYVATTATVNCQWIEFSYIGTNATGKRGIEINTTTGACSLLYCSMHDCDANAVYMIGAAFSNVTLQYSVLYNTCIAIGTSSVTTSTPTTGTWTIDSCMICGVATSGTAAVVLADVGGTFTNNSISGASSASNGVIQLNEAAPLGTFSNISSHSNGGSGILIQSSPSGTLANLNIWRNSTNGILFGANQNGATTLDIAASNFFGNATSGFSLNNDFLNLVIDTCTFNGDTTFSQTSGLIGGAYGSIRMYSCSFSVVSGIKTKCTNDLNFNSNTFSWVNFADDCIFNGTNVYAGILNIPAGAFLRAQNFGQTANDNRSYYATGTATAAVIQTNTSVVYSTNIRSEQMSPATASLKLSSQSILVQTPSGKVCTPTVQVQINGTYNGNNPRLILKRQDSMGVTSDTVLQTFSAGTNTWQGLTGSTGAAPQDGVFEFVIDCDGTAGSVFVGNAVAVLT